MLGGSSETYYKTTGCKCKYEVQWIKSYDEFNNLKIDFNIKYNKQRKKNRK